jgi:uroporphyrin-III C-methyltransferase
MSGKVYIVGAGPGAADLLTLRAASLLQRADVVLHDDLVPQDVIDVICPSAEVVNVGKRCGKHGTTQEKINQLLVQYAGEKSIVVRLKAGDPAVFGRLGEELDALRDAGVAFEIVPGITAANAAAAAAGFTLTDRRAASALVILTGHSCRGESLANTLLDPEQATYAVYMPGPDYSRTAGELIRSGLSETTPCAVISNAGRPHQQVKFLSLSQLKSMRAALVPAVLIVGKVVSANNFAQNNTFLEEIYESVCQPGPHPAYQ